MKEIIMCFCTLKDSVTVKPKFLTDGKSFGFRTLKDIFAN